MRYSGIIFNDTTAAPGISVSFFTQGCPHHCEGCFNPETWDFDGGKPFVDEVIDEIIEGLTANGIQRSLSILGGEPMCYDNMPLVELIIDKVKEILPEVKVYIWTGYRLEDLKARNNELTDKILSNIHCLIDGPFVLAERDITLPMRGSRNQRIIYLDNEKNI